MRAEYNGPMNSESRLSIIIFGFLALAIAIPLVLSTAYINVRIRKLEDLVGVGMTRLLETVKAVLTQRPAAN